MIQEIYIWKICLGKKIVSINFYTVQGRYTQSRIKFLFKGQCNEYMCAQSYLTLCNPVDCGLPVSSVHGIF